MLLRQYRNGTETSAVEVLTQRCQNSFSPGAGGHMSNTAALEQPVETVRLYRHNYSKTY